MKLSDEIISKILLSEERYLFLASLISSDTILSKQDATESLEMVNYIIDNIDKFNLSDKIKSEVVKYLHESKMILNQNM